MIETSTAQCDRIQTLPLLPPEEEWGSVNWPVFEQAGLRAGASLEEAIEEVESVLAGITFILSKVTGPAAARMAAAKTTLRRRGMALARKGVEIRIEQLAREPFGAIFAELDGARRRTYTRLRAETDKEVKWELLSHLEWLKRTELEARY